MTPHPDVRDGVLVVELTIRNTGDEAARSVVPALHFRGDTTRGELQSVLLPQQIWETKLEVAAPSLGAGRWPYRIVVGYADANQYPFHALHVGTIVVGSPPLATVALFEIDAPRLATSGVLESRVKNLSGEARTLAIDVHLPDGIELAEPIDPIEIAAWEESPVAARLVNRTGLPGSRYAVFVSAEYDEKQGIHQAVLLPSTVEIVAAQSAIEDNGPWLSGAAGLLVLGWAGALLWRRAARRR